MVSGSLFILHFIGPSILSFFIYQLSYDIRYKMHNLLRTIYLPFVFKTPVLYQSPFNSLSDKLIKNPLLPLC